MNLFSPIARVVAWIGAAMIMTRHWGKETFPQAQGLNPTIPAAVPQGIPTLKMPTAHGWHDGKTPVPAPIKEIASEEKKPFALLVGTKGPIGGEDNPKEEEKTRLDE